jgi:DNA-binding response OmpR family regulator
MDLHLPDTDGWMLIRELRAHEAWKRVPILVVSACVRELDREQAFDAGCDAFLGKPCDPSDLIAELKRLIGRSPESSGRVTTAAVSVGATAAHAVARSSAV